MKDVIFLIKDSGFDNGKCMDLMIIMIEELGI